MEMRRLGKTDLQITPLGFGAWAVGGSEWRFGWGAQDDEQSIAAIRHAIARGINWIDTAAAYGLGHSEEIVRRALADIPASERPYVFTKCALKGTGDGGVVESLDPAFLREECENSLRRLGVEAIDLFQIHWPTDEIADIDGGWATLLDLKRAGKVRHIGVSNFNVAELERAEKHGPVETLQPPYSAIMRDVEHEILPYCQKHDIGTIVYSPMQSGLLTGAMTRERALALPENDWRSRNAEFQEPKLSRNLALAELFRRIGERDGGRSVAEVALAWTLHNPAVTAAIVGARSPEQVDGWIGAADYRLTDAAYAEIAAFLAEVPA
jgi:aryl-alcohol dehydrogenase-like predicted oxidoreductase